MMWFSLRARLMSDVLSCFTNELFDVISAETLQHATLAVPLSQFPMLCLIHLRPMNCHRTS